MPKDKRIYPKQLKEENKMGMRINNNIAAMNAWRNLGISNAGLGKSLEKLSSGYRINRGADDPAGLLISEKLRGQITGLDQAMKNANDAISMVQTAEGALTEMNSMLNNIRSLAVHAANAGASDADSIAADQTAIDEAVNSIERIATTTKFGGKNLLDGTAGNTASAANTTNVTNIVTGTLGASGLQSVTVSVAAEQAITYGSNTFAVTASTTSTGSFQIWSTTDGADGQIKSYNYAAGTSLQTILDGINANTGSTGIVASVGAGNSLAIYSQTFGDKVSVHVRGVGSVLTVNNTTLMALDDDGVDVGGSIGTIALQGSGLVLYGSATTAYDGTKVYLSSAFAASAQTTANAMQLDAGELSFALTQDAAAADVVTFSMSDMQTTKIGNVGSAYLSAIVTSGAKELATDADGAVAIIDAAIDDVANERARLGAFQKYTLESTINNLGVTRENLQASESRIRDVDMADEMLTFTKNQILVQAGTAMLAQANQLPQSVLQLLQG
jgi:flagellin